MVDTLVKAGADVNKTTTDVGATPLYSATARGHEGIIEKLVEAGADVNKATAVDGCTPLYHAPHNGREAIVSRLLNAGADPNIDLILDNDNAIDFLSALPRAPSWRVTARFAHSCSKPEHT